jgi:hypothetical protein
LQKRQNERALPFTRTVCLSVGHSTLAIDFAHRQYGKTHFARELTTMSPGDNFNLVKSETMPDEISGPFADYEATYRRALVKHARELGIKLNQPA